jgi:hypothetical protein
MSTRAEVDVQYRTLATILGAMVIGQLIFAGVAWFLKSSMAPTQPIKNPITYAWLFIMISTLPIAFMLRQRLSGLRDSPSAALDIRSGKITMATVLPQAVIMFALLEGGGLLGLVNYFLHPHPTLLLATLAYIIVTSVIFFPRRAWFDVFHQP